jgi:hypothetical protein
MKLPAWVWWHGLLPHGAAGLMLTIVGWFDKAPSGFILFAALAAGLLHEQGDGDLAKPSAEFPGVPGSEGILDALMFLPVPLVWFLLANFGSAIGF